MAEDKLVNESFDYSKEGDLSDKVVSKGEKPKLSPNPDGSGYVKQVLVSSESTSGIIDPEENVLYILSDGRQFKYLIDHDPHFVRVENGPNYQTKDGGRETPHRVVTSPKEAFEKIFNGNVGFNGGVFVKGKKLEDYIDSQGGVTQAEMEEYVGGAIQADKEVISQIKVEYDEENGNTNITLPKYIYPLSIYVDGNLFFDFQNDHIIKDDFDVVGYIQYDNDLRAIQLVFSGVRYEKTDINRLDYILFNGVEPTNYLSNTYYLYNPVTSGGTKLYAHQVQISANNTMYICNCVTTSPDYFNDGSSEILFQTGGNIIIAIVNGETNPDFIWDTYNAEIIVSGSNYSVSNADETVTPL